jgi:Flp pilus assembly protein TadG
MRRVAYYVLRVRLRVRALRSDQSGVTAIEFGVLALPFFMLLFGLISVCLFFFTTFTFENAVWQASRGIRTGQLQQGSGTYAGLKTNEDRKKAFEKNLCDLAPPFVDCTKIVVQIQSNNAGFSGLTQPACTSGGKMINQSAASFNTGGASSVVLITGCYPWEFGAKLPFISLGNNSVLEGALLIQATVAFRTEPFPTN